MSRDHVYINGKWCKGEGEKRAMINPSNEEVIIEINEASQQQAVEAIQAARHAFRYTDWPSDPARRTAALRQLADLLEKSAETFASIETLNTGKPIRESRLDVSDSIHCLRYYADFVEQRTVQEKRRADGTTSKVIEEPIGVCALIVPWNFPLLLGIWKIAPALAAGNTIVFKPSELTPLSLLELTKLIDSIGLPPGVFNLVPGGGSPVGETLVTHPDVEKISFTGGTETGRWIYEQCARRLKRVSLELGGKSPLLIFDDADLTSTIEWALFASFLNQGEVCVAASRILVQRRVYDSFIDQLIKRLASLHIGDPFEENTEMGPLISSSHLEKVETYIQIGLQEGAVLLQGGERIKERGYYLTPAVFAHVRQDMRIVQEEIFGPVITVQPFEHDEEAIGLANDTIYGLAAGIFSRDLERAEQIAGKLRAGTIWINSYHTPYVDAPWGGFKQSGIGRELGPQGFAAFTETKHVNISQHGKQLGWYSSYS
ncbi:MULTISPECIES: aldehyde dehydrogenase family protein [Geobacillus]|uniref:Betaine-aldehyde dehydrogenase n=4 Tax=Geobacillus TaxID=129337 RepID=A0A7U9P7C3_GEOTM|nr:MULTISPECIES: aldehyde dehydrogenase family protein [Geobacillus]AWO75861.1 aldehyde dehydrogenase [Geobacillus thermoleovorans]ESU72524.1 betaine-aldehyde dehydrogenase [Geobacillus sp. MAS1]MBW7644106.1 aldehyde dehydrogenase family protein [Geobacillus thermoleovorans]OQP11984.1 aldehyde dehydrogenase [Geobacillus thermoleovorans]QNU21709.1 aldehyde dehydrogenase family protein [Geobacillus thermoleovorans]